MIEAPSFLEFGLTICTSDGSNLLQSAGPGETSLIYTAIGDLLVETGDFPVDFMAVAVAFFSGGFRLDLRSDEAIEGEEEEVERTH